MPTYEFTCEDCGTDFETLCAFDSTGEYAEVSCTNCSSKRKCKKITVPFFQFNQPAGTDRWNNSHDYRYKTKLPEVAAEREAAEAALKYTPYRSLPENSY